MASMVFYEYEWGGNKSTYVVLAGGNKTLILKSTTPFKEFGLTVEQATKQWENMTVAISDLQKALK